MYKLTPVQSELETVKLIFSKYLELKSLHAVETFLRLNHIKTKRSCNFLPSTVLSVLENPVYAIADSAMYDYLQSNNCDIASAKTAFDGKHGLMAYNRTRSASGSGGYQPKNDISDWIIAVGKHDGVILGAEWVLTQSIRKASATQNCYKVRAKSKCGILGGLIKCAHCQSTMRLKKGKILKDGTQAFVYICSTKEVTKRQLCNQKNVQGKDIDSDVLNYLISLADESSEQMQILCSKKQLATQAVETNNNELQLLKSEVEEKETAIENLLQQLSTLHITQTEISNLIIAQIDKLNKEATAIRQQLTEAEIVNKTTGADELAISLVQQALVELKNLVTLNDIDMQRTLVKNVVKQMVWDGTRMVIELYYRDSAVISGTYAPETLHTDSECYRYKLESLIT